MITYDKLIKKILSFLLVFIILTPNLTNNFLFGEETSKYSYTLFGRNGITISALSNLSINGNIHTNKEASVSSQNKNVNGRVTTGNDIEKRVKHVYADKKIYQTYFTQNCEIYESEYVRSELNININNPVFSYENIIFNGNVSLNSNIGTYMDINITGEVKNANNSVVYSKYGDITIENNSTANINGLIYAPLGTLTINAPNINLGGIIIADEVIINGSNVNINCNDNIARFIGTTSEAYDFSGLEYLPEEWLGDTDLDDLFDIYEKVIDTDPLNPDTDFDELPDGYEVLTLNTDPLEVDTDLNGIWDKDEDFDSDNLSNLGEYQNKTEPFIPDSDEDGLLDGDEVHTYGTDPLNPDTDADKLLDGEEGYSGTIFTKYGVYFDPLMPDTDGNGILDGDEIFGQSKQQQVQTHDGAIVGVYVNMNTNGNLDKNLSIENVYNIDMLSSNVVGLVGDPFEFKATTNFDSATITFEFDQYKVNSIKLQNLIVLWYDEENQRYMECSEKNGYYTKIDNSAISVTTTHFSKYMVVDKIAWYEAWEQSFQRFYYAAPSGAGQPNQVPIDHYNTVFVVDTSGSMSDDPNGEWLGYDSIKKLYTKPMPPISDPAMYDYWWKTYGYYSCKRITACENFIDTMYPNDNAAIISFAYGNNQYTKVQAFLSSDKEYLKNSLQSFYDDGGTCFSYAINMAVGLIPENEILKNNVVNRIVFLSDGEPENDTLTDINAAIDNAKAKGIKIYTIGLGIENTVLSNMAIDTGGKSYEGIEASELPRVVSQATSPHSNDPNPDFNSLMNMHSDDDNLPDLVEQFGLRPNGQPLGTYVDSLDSDGDGLSDGDEITFKRDEFVEGLKSGDCSRGIKMISDPLLEDGDGDGVKDNEDPLKLTYGINCDMSTECKDQLFSEIDAQIKNDFTPIEQYKGYYSTSECIDTLYKYDELITKLSNIYMLPKATMQSILLREMLCYYIMDDLSDALVIQQYDYLSYLEYYNSLDFVTQFIVPAPIKFKPIVDIEDSSVGLGQIFARTAIVANNWAVLNGIITGKIYDYNNWNDRKEIWYNLKGNSSYNIEMVAIVLMWGMTSPDCPMQTTDRNYWDFSDEQFKAMFTRYNSDEGVINIYGKEVYNTYKIFCVYN